jgi:hypothetical protein
MGLLETMTDAWYEANPDARQGVTAHALAEA